MSRSETKFATFPQIERPGPKHQPRKTQNVLAPATRKASLRTLAFKSTTPANVVGTFKFFQRSKAVRLPSEMQFKLPKNAPRRPGCNDFRPCRLFNDFDFGTALSRHWPVQILRTSSQRQKARRTCQVLVWSGRRFWRHLGQPILRLHTTLLRG